VIHKDTCQQIYKGEVETLVSKIMQDYVIYLQLQSAASYIQSIGC